MTDARILGRPLKPAFGDEVEGVDLARPVSEGTALALRRRLAERRVLLFRNQSLTPEAQVQALGIFGEVVDETGTGARFANISAEPSSLVKPGRLLFHVERHPTPFPLKALSLYGDVIGPGSTPTLFADMVGAAERLPPELRAKAAGRSAVNVSYYLLGQGGDRTARSVEPDHPDAQRHSHPILADHPDTGAKHLFVSELNTRQVEGMALEESDTLLGALYAQLYASDNVYQHDWRQGDLLVWDNRGVQHARGEESSAPVAEGAAPRRLRRVVVGRNDLDDHYKTRAAALG